MGLQDVLGKLGGNRGHQGGIDNVQQLFGQFVGSFDPADAAFGYAVAQLVTFVGLE